MAAQRTRDSLWTLADVAAAAETSISTVHATFNVNLDNEDVKEAIRLLYPKLSDAKLFGPNK